MTDIDHLQATINTLTRALAGLPLLEPRTKCSNTKCSNWAQVSFPELEWLCWSCWLSKLEREAIAEAWSTRSASEPAITPEPPPKPSDGPELWPLVVEDLRREGAPSSLIADAQARDAWGRSKYGTPLRARNGSDAMVDAYQEALDLAVYLRQATEESNLYSELFYRKALGLLRWIHVAIRQWPDREGWWWCEVTPGYWQPLFVHNPTGDGLEVYQRGPITDFQCVRWGERCPSPAENERPAQRRLTTAEREQLARDGRLRISDRCDNCKQYIPHCWCPPDDVEPSPPPLSPAKLEARFGQAGVRDPDNPCDGFEPGEPGEEGGDCYTDGHYCGPAPTDDYERGRDHERLDVIDFLQYPPGRLPDHWKTCVAELLVALKAGRHVGSAKRLYDRQSPDPIGRRNATGVDDDQR